MHSSRSQLRVPGAVVLKGLLERLQARAVRFQQAIELSADRIHQLDGWVISGRRLVRGLCLHARLPQRRDVLLAAAA